MKCKTSIVFLIIICIIFISNTVFSQQNLRVLNVNEYGVVTLSDQSKYVLADIIMPSMINMKKYAEISHNVFIEKIKDSYVTVETINDAKDRYQRKLVYIKLDNGKYIQQILISEGVAAVFPVTRAYERIDDLLTFEAKARDEKKHIWQEKQLEIKPTTLLEQDNSACLHMFCLISGEIIDVAKRHNRIYMNTRQDWAKDATLLLEKKHTKDFELYYSTWNNIKNRKFIARGWIEQYNGPLLKLMHPMQLQLVKTNDETIRAEQRRNDAVPIY